MFCLPSFVVHISYFKLYNQIVYYIADVVGVRAGNLLTFAFFLASIASISVHALFGFLQVFGLYIYQNSHQTFQFLLLKEKVLLQYQASLGICDGINKIAGMSVDNLSFEPVHANKITEIINI